MLRQTLILYHLKINAFMSLLGHYNKLLRMLREMLWLYYYFHYYTLYCLRVVYFSNEYFHLAVSRACPNAVKCPFPTDAAATSIIN